MSDVGRPWTVGESGVAVRAHTGRGERRTTAETRPWLRAGPGVSNDTTRSRGEGHGEAVDGGRVEVAVVGPYR